MAPRACSVTRTIPFALQAGSKVLQESVAPLWSKAGSLPIQYGNRTLDPTHPCQQACFITELLKPSLANATVVDILQLQNTTHYNVKVLSQCKIEVEVIEVTHTVQIRIPISTITQGGKTSAIQLKSQNCSSSTEHMQTQTNIFWAHGIGIKGTRMAITLWKVEGSKRKTTREMNGDKHQSYICICLATFITHPYSLWSLVV